MVSQHAVVAFRATGNSATNASRCFSLALPRQWVDFGGRRCGTLDLPWMSGLTGFPDGLRNLTNRSRDRGSPGRSVQRGEG